MDRIRTFLEMLRYLITGEKPSIFEPPKPEREERPRPQPPPEPEVFAPPPSSESSVAVEFERAARTAFRQGRYEEAIELARKCLELDDLNLMAYYYLGLAYVELGQWAAGLAVFQQAQSKGDPLGLAEGWIAEVEQRRAAAEEKESGETGPESAAAEGGADSGGS